MIGLSPPRGVYRQTLVIRVALGIAALVFAGISFAIGMGSNASDFPGIAVAAVILIAYAVICYLIAKTTITVYPEGIQRTTAFGTKEMLWSEVAEYRYRIVPRQTGFAVGGLIGAAVEAAINVSQGNPGGPPTVTLVGQNGKRLQVTPNFKDSEEAIDTVLSEVHNRLKPPLKQRLANNDVVSFGPLKLSFQGVGWKNKAPIPLDDVGNALISGRKLRIRRKGKLLDAIGVAPEKVPNALLALELIEELRVNAGISGVASTFS
ncbi:MAG TPA: DUF6585 family protein [Thermoanaerobaculia bacterium]|nr:DUF6585 family protein [Thermoanaerobaculia bacterium]